MLRRLLATTALFAAATASAAGINLRWDSCAGPSTRAFACNTNAGTDHLFGSWVAPAGVTAPVENHVVLDIQSADGAMPAWWDFAGAGSCRGSWLTISGDGSTDASGTCADFWQGQGIGALVSYTSLRPGARRLTAILAQAAVAGLIDADVEYFSFRLGIGHAATVNTACTGCLAPLCIVLQSIRIVQPAGVGDVLLTAPAQVNWVTWQSGAPDCSIVPVRNRTWGEVKALYR